MVFGGRPGIERGGDLISSMVRPRKKAGVFR